MIDRTLYDYLLNHASKVARDSALVKGLRPWLYSKQNGLCWDCAEPLNGYADGTGTELCHIVGGMRSAGIVAGNVALGHRACNVRQVKAFGSVIPWQYVAPRAKRIPAYWPDRRVLVAIGREDAAKREREDAECIRAMLRECGLRDSQSA